MCSVAEQADDVDDENKVKFKRWQAASCTDDKRCEDGRGRSTSEIDSGYSYFGKWFLNADPCVQVICVAYHLFPYGALIDETSGLDGAAIDRPAGEVGQHVHSWTKPSNDSFVLCIHIRRGTAFSLLVFLFFQMLPLGVVPADNLPPSHPIPCPLLLCHQQPPCPLTLRP